MHYIPLDYLDPGTGSFLIQILIAALLGIGVAIRASWSKIKKLFGKNQVEEQTDEDDDTKQ